MNLERNHEEVSKKLELGDFLLNNYSVIFKILRNCPRLNGSNDKPN